MLNHLLPLSSKVYIVLYDKPEVIDTESSKFLLYSIISNYKDKNKIEVLTSKANFAELNEIPEDFLKKEAFTIATSSRKIYSNLVSKGYPYILFLKKPFGWRDCYQATAFLRSVALFNVEHASWISLKNKNNNINNGEKFE
jgi:hypothetical protein